MARRILLAYLIVLGALALLPLGAGAGRGAGPGVQAMPLATILAALARGLTLGTAVSVGGNLVAFVPLGLLAPMASARWRSAGRVLALGLGVSLAIESAQLAISLALGDPYRRADVDDLLLNVLGTALGFGLYRLEAARRDRRASRAAPGPSLVSPSADR